VKKKQTNKQAWILAAVLIALTVLTFAAYWRVLRCEFVNYDDDVYITKNPHISAGLTQDNIRWAFTTVEAANWHPLTWLSYLVDAQAGGVDAGRFHLTNLMLHLASALLLFLLLRRMLRSSWRSALVAALFAVHPLHVESVAWVAERKDVLSTLLWLLTMWAYVRYTEKPGLRSYIPVALLFVLGLMSKPMLVTLPFTLLLLDYWPLGRLQTADCRLQTRDQRERKGLWKLVWEKAPLFVLSLASCVITFYAQNKSGAVNPFSRYSMGARIENALCSYAAYLWKMVVPAKLAAFYPHPGHLPVWETAGCTMILALITAFVLRASKKRPYLLFGWLWYVITLIPVIGIVQVGWQAMADRYAYVPLIGIFIAIAWAIPEPRRRLMTVATSAVLCAVVATMAVMTSIQTRYWQDGYSLFTHAIDVTKDNYLAYNNLGNIYKDQGDIDTAADYYRRALSAYPDYSLAHLNLCFVLTQQGRISEAVEEGQTAIGIAPESYEAHNNLAIALAQQGRLAESIDEFRKVVALQDYYPRGHFNLGRALMLDGKHDEAMEEYKVAADQQPDFADPHGGLAIELFMHGDYAGAWREAHACEQLGGTPDPKLLAQLSSKMPDPGQ
jgi:protein O-mannosyl-transferase